jgi:hypothetical protein
MPARKANLPENRSPTLTRPADHQIAMLFGYKGEPSSQAGD